MPHNSNTVLYEEIELYAASNNGRAIASINSQKQRAPDLHDQGGLLVSPDSSSVAVLDSTATLVTVLHSREGSAVSDTDAETTWRDLVVVRSFQPTRITGGCLSASDAVASYCWSADSSRLAVACASGYVYVLDRSGQPVALLQPSAGLWTGKPLGALAMPLPSTLFLLTARPAQLFVVPLDAPLRFLQSLRPQQLSRQHGVVRVAAYDARTSTLVVAGEGSAAGGGAKIAGSVLVSVSAWRLELSGPGPAAAAAAKAVLLGSFTGPIQDAVPAASGGASSGAAWSRRRWTLSLSPLGEHVALVAPPAAGVLLLSLPQCQRVDPAERFCGRTAPRASGFQTTLARSVGSAVSASWWSSDAALALSDLGGYVGLAQLPGYENLLAGDEQPKYEPGALVASKTSGPGARGLLVLEPVMCAEAKPGYLSAAVSDAKRGARMSSWGAAASPEPEAAARPPGSRLLLLAERTPEEMLKVHMRHQQWGRALELCAAAGLDADRVYAARWASRPVDAANITDNLAKIADRRWVVEECCSRVAADYEGQRKLINYGLRETARQAKPAAAADSTDDASSTASAAATPGGATAAADGSRESTDPWDTVWWRCTRLRLWRHSDRLEVLYAAQGRTFNPAAYTAFRDLPVAAAAGSWAATGAVGPLAVLAQHYPASLSGPVLLGVLSRLPETINPRLYSALLPKVNCEGSSAPPLPPPARKLDWVEQPELLTEIRSVLAVGPKAESATGSPDLDPEATDALVRVLAPRPRLSVSVVSEWYADRALQLDTETGQLQNALTLLELGWERGARGPRVAQLLGAARALAGVVGNTGGPHASRTAGSRLAGGALWQLRLEVFAAMQGGQQLRLLLSGTDENNMEEELRDRVVPFLHGPGWDAPAVGPLVGALLTQEMAARPAWAAALIEAEARCRMLLGNTGELVQAVTAAVVGCPQTDEWPVLTRAVEAVEAAVWKEAEAEAENGPTADGSLAEAAGGWMAGLQELRGFLRAGSLLAARGLPLTVRHISSCGHEEAARCVRQVLGGIQRSSSSMSDASWSELWRDLVQVRSTAFPFLTPEELLSEVARCMMHCGRNDLANAYLHGGAPAASEGGGVHVALEDAAADALVVSVAMEILAGATDPWDSAAQQAAACLALASPDTPSAIALRRLMSALQLLPEMGVDLMPAQVMHMQDRFEVLRLILDGAPDGALVNEVGFAATSVGVGIGGTFGLAASAALGGKFSRRRAAVRAAGKAAAAGGRAAAALAGGLLAVAGRVAGANVAEAVAGRMAPVAGIVAGAVAATVSAAAAAAPSAAVGAVGGGAQPPYKQVGRLLELAELLGLDSQEDELRVKDLAGRAALRAGDLGTAQQLALGLLARRYVPAWSLCADLGSTRQLQDDVVRQQLLSFALLHCPAERMTRLLEDLRAAEKRCSGEAGGADPLVEAPEYLLRVALLAPGQRVGAGPPGASPTACLPSPGDTQLALAVLGPGVPGSGAAAAKLLESLHGSGGASEDGGVGLPYAQQQRVMAMECYSHCLRALLPTARSGVERLQILEQPLGELLRQVRQLDLTTSGPSAESAAAALEAEARLVAARDSRTVRQHVPGVDAMQFASGGEEYRRQAILQQAALAGAVEAEAPGASPRAAELLEQARRLAGVYGVDKWEVELHFTSGLITGCATTTVELRAAVQSREPGLLQRPVALLRHLAAVTYPALPPSSGPHLALWLMVLTDCLHSCAQHDRTAATLAAIAAPLFGKLRDLLEKAGAALKGLALTHVHAPFLAQLLAPLDASLIVQSAAPSETVHAPTVAAAAIFSYVKPSNLTQAVKLLTALHRLLGPLVKRTTSGSGAQLFPGLQQALDELPASLPYLCLCVKAVGTRHTTGSGGLQHHQQAQQPQRDMAVAWGHVAEHVVRLPFSDLAAWLAFLLLPGSPCPLGPGITGAPLAPCPCPVDVRLTVLDACMPKLQPSAAAIHTQPSAIDAQGSGAAVAADQELLHRLRSLHRRLLVLRAARQHAADGVDEEQLRNLELSLLQTEETPSGTSDAGAVRRALSNLAAAGCPAAVLLDIAVVAVDLPTDGGDRATGPGSSQSSPAQEMVEGAVSDALGSALQALLGEEMQASAGQFQLRGLLKCLDRQPHLGSDSLTPTSPMRTGATEALRTLRDLVWHELQRFTDERLSALEQLRPTAASELLDMQAALGTRTMWQDWVFGGGSADDPRQHRLKLIATRTRALLAHMRTPNQSSSAPEQISVSAGQGTIPATAAATSTVVQVEDLATCAAAERLFSRLLQAARASNGSGDDTVGRASLVQLRLLARLLVEVWRNGDIWGREIAVNCNQEENGNRNGEEAGVVEASVEVSALHRCWRELAEELLQGRHLVEVVSILDPPGSATSTEAAHGLLPGDVNKELLQSSTSLASSCKVHLLPLSSDDVEHLIRVAATSADGAAAASWCLGLASPYKEHRMRALEELQATASPAADAPDASSDAVLADGSGPIQPDTAVLLLALLIRSGDAVQLAASVNPLLLRLVLSVPVSPVESAAWESQAPLLPCRDARTAGYVLPCMAALLTERRHCGYAAVLVSHRLHLHPALGSATGSLFLLERYLKTVSSFDDKPVGACQVSPDLDSAGVGLLRCWPAAVEQLQLSCKEWCRRALRVLTASTTE